MTKLDPWERRKGEDRRRGRKRIKELIEKGRSKGS